MSKNVEQKTEKVDKKTLKKEEKITNKIQKNEVVSPKEKPAKQEKRGSKTKLIVIIVLSCVLAVGVGLGLYFILRDTRKNPVVNAVVAEKTYYAGFTLETVEISLGEGSTKGTIEWENDGTVLVVGSHSYSYKFTPKNKDKYYSKTGKVKVIAVEAEVNSVTVKTSPTKVEGYSAFDVFDGTGMVLEATFSSGAKQEFSTGYTVVYEKQDATTFLAGDTKVTIVYAGKTCEVEIAEVSKLKIDEPVISGEYVYDGEDKTPEIAESERYSFLKNAAIDADDYDIEITLTDPVNTMWTNHPTDEVITLIWTIEEAELDVVEKPYSSSYDAEAHTVSVEGENVAEVYYSNDGTQLDSSNYKTKGSTVLVSKTNVSTTTVYYYAVGAKNYKDASGVLELKITKASAKVNLSQNAYLILKGMTNTELGENNVSVVGAKDADVPFASKVNFVYYTKYTNENNNTKTTTANGAAIDGGVPTNIGNYYVVVEFEGDDTYFDGISNATPYIVEEVNTDLISTTLPSFDFKTTDETKYFEFKINNSTSPSSFTFTSNEFESAVITKVQGFYVFENDQEVHKIQLSADETTLEITNTSTGNVKTFEKWYAPDFVGTYSCNTAYDADNPSILSIYLEDGEIKFNFIQKIYQYGGATERTISGTVRYDEDLLTFDYGLNFAATWDVQNDMIIVERTEADGDYTRVA